MSRDLFTPAAAGKYVGVSRQAVEQRVERLGYKPVDISGKKFIRRAWLDTWRKERRAGAEAILAK